MNFTQRHFGDKLKLTSVFQKISYYHYGVGDQKLRFRTEHGTVFDHGYHLLAQTETFH